MHPAVPVRDLRFQPLQALAEPGAADHNVPRYVFEARGDATAPEPSAPTLAGYGITMMPEETGPTACPMFHLFLWPPSGALFGQAYNPANNTTPGDPRCRTWRRRGSTLQPRSTRTSGK